MNKNDIKKFKILTFGELVAETKSMPKKVTIWAGIKEGSFGFIFGPSKSGKTTFSENLALSLVVGRSMFWGVKLYDGKAHKVAFISLEENCLPRVERAQKQFFGLTDVEKKLVNDNYFQPDCNFQQSINNSSDWTLLENAIKISGAKIVFIDSLTRLYAGSIEESQVAQKLTLRLRKITRDLGITLICIHHTTKTQGKLLTQDSIAGSRVILQEADFGIAINKSSEGKRYLKEVFYRYEKQSDTEVREFYIDDNLWLQNTGNIQEYKLFQYSDGRKSDDNLNTIKNHIKLHNKDNHFYIKDLLAQFVNTKIVSKPTLYKILKDLANEGIISILGSGAYKLIENDVKEASDEK